jgi:hypothetical protein
MVLMFIGEVVVAIFIIAWIIRAVPFLYAGTHPFFEWLGNLIKHF